MSAKFVDAFMGYNFFMEKRGKVSLEKINNFLERSGRNHISQRTYTHYRSLMRHGFTSYFPINQFDVSRTLGLLPIEPDRRRYKREGVDIEAAVSSDGSKWIQARIIDKSLVGFGMKTTEKRLLKPGNLIWVSMNQYRNIPAILVWRKRDNNKIRFGVKAIEFIANYRISEKGIIPSKPIGSIIIRKISEEDISWREIFRIIEKVHELILASSALLDEIAKFSGLTEFHLEQPVLSSISFSSPFNFEIKVDFNLVKILETILRWCFLGKVIKERYKEETEIDKKEKLLEIEYRRHSLKSKRKATKLAIPHELSSSLKEQIKDSLNIKKLAPSLFDPESVENGIVNDQILPAAIELASGDDPDIEITIKSESDNNDNNGNKTKGKA